MVAELEKIIYDDGGGFRASYISDTSGLWHFHPEYELVLNIKSNGTRIVVIFLIAGTTTSEIILFP
jgi:hypothetical protein